MKINVSGKPGVRTQKELFLSGEPTIKVVKSPAKRGLMSKRKGQVGEREALAELSSWIRPVYERFEVPAETIKRNLDQVREGGCDLKGLPWLSIEIKRQEIVSLTSWWKQTVVQAGPGETPFLMWRCSRQPWRFRIRAPVVIGPLSVLLDMDLEADQARSWLEAQLSGRLLAAKRGQAFVDGA